MPSANSPRLLCHGTAVVAVDPPFFFCLPIVFSGFPSLACPAKLPYILQHARWKLRPWHPKRDHVKQNKSDQCNASLHLAVAHGPSNPSPSLDQHCVLSLFCLPPVSIFFSPCCGSGVPKPSHPVSLREKAPLFFWEGGGGMPQGSTVFGLLSKALHMAVFVARPSG